MEVIHQRCAGLDVHKDIIVASVRVAAEDKVKSEVKSFESTTKGLLALSDWLTESGCTHVAMESTGVYWKPVWHILEGSFELVLANAMHIRNVPGRKSDVNDATWISNLLAHGLIRGSFVPPMATQELRGLTRTRKQFVRESARHTQRIQRTLEDANLKIAGAVRNILGKSGRAILEALIKGETDPERLADLTDKRVKASRETLVEALRGRVTAHHRFLLKLHLDQIDSLSAAVRDVEARMGESLAPFRAQVERLKTIPGVSDVVAQVIAAEIGLDMSRFPSAGHLVSWAGLCPQMDETAGKKRSTRIRKGAPWLKATIVQAAWPAVRTKNSYLRAQFHRLKARRGSKRAIVAVAASMITATYYILRDGVDYQDLGADHYERRDKSKIANRLIRRLEDLGVHVEVKAAA